MLLRSPIVFAAILFATVADAGDDAAVIRSASSCAENCAYSQSARTAAVAALSQPYAPPPMSIACPLTCPLVWTRKRDIIAITLALQGTEGSAAGIIGDKLYVSHGFVGDGTGMGADGADLRIYDIPTDTWSIGPPAAPGPARSEGGGAVVGTTFYSIGGRGFPILEAFDTLTMTWAAPEFTPTGRKGSAIAVINGLIHAVGGSMGSGPNIGVPMTTHDVYDPVALTWSTRAPLPVALMDIYAAAAIGTRLYVFGGYDGVGVVNTTYIYDAVVDAWSLGAPMPTPRSNAVAGVLCGHIFVIGGLDAAATVSMTVVEAYDPVGNSWCTGPSKPLAVSEGATGAISTPTAIHVVGSGPSGVARSFYEILEIVPGTCVTPDLTRISDLKAVRSGANVRFEWLPDSNAVEYHLNSVTDKLDIRVPNANLPPTGGARPQCSATTTNCVGADPISAGMRLFYQVFSACGASGSDEGPI